MRNSKNSLLTRSFTLKALVISGVFTLSFFIIKGFKTKAVTTQDVATQVTVGNTNPNFTAGPFEDPASTATSPTAVGSAVTFKATATDSNGEPYYLTVCKTDAITPSSSGAGTCASTADTYCSSTSTNSGSEASCSYNTVNADPWSNGWFAFVCDANATAPACSTASQGDLSENDGSESPFFVNHVPTFSAISNDSPKNPGETITWTATASDTDGDVTLLVCKTNQMTNGTCTGGAWCTATAASNPSCGYDIPGVNPAGSNDAYVFVVDALNTPATGTAQGTESSFTVNNISPQVTAVTLNGGNDITLVEKYTNPSAKTEVPVTATIVDTNGCDDITTVTANVYRSSETCNSTVSDENFCYHSISCTQVANSCVETSGTANYTCTAELQYFADPTDADTPSFADTWLANVFATDGGNASHNLVLATGVEVNKLLAFQVTGSIQYGGVNPGDSRKIEVPLITEATGNTGIDQDHSGSANMCTDFPTCSPTGGRVPIPVNNQKYSTTIVDYSSGGFALSTTPTRVLLNVKKPTSPSSQQKSTYWGIAIPGGTPTGVYNGLNTITAQVSATDDW